MNPTEVRVVFMGSPAFAVPSLIALATAGYDVVGVVTQPDRPAGRGGAVHMPEVKAAALELSLNVFQPETFKDTANIERLASFAPDLFVVAAYGKILPRTVLAIPRRGTVNVHASLLPRWRGASPINAAILAGDAQTGVSIMEMVFKMDAGPVISATTTPILASDTTATLEPRLAQLGAGALVETLPRWLDGDTHAVPQDEDRVTYCHTLKKEEGHLRADMTATEAERAVRAYDPWPGAYVLYRGERLAIWQTTLVETPADQAPGAVSVVGRCPAVTFADGQVLVLEAVQKPGGRRISGEQFLNGERGKLESKVTLA